MVKKVKELMNKNVTKIGSGKTVLDAARLMAKNGVGCIIITSGIKVLGIVTERDLVSRVLAKPFDPTRLLVSDIATMAPYTISPDKTILDAAALMVKYNVRRLPVINKRRLVGIVTANDLARSMLSVGDQGLVVKALTRDKPIPHGIYG